MTTSAPVLALTSTGEVAQPLRYVYGPEAVLTKVYMALSTVAGEYPLDGRVGLPRFDWSERPRVPLVEIEATVRAQCEAVAGVLSVDSVEARRVDGQIVCSVRLTIGQPDGSRVSATVSTDPLLTAGAPAWYTISGAGISGPILGG